ncbi:hypothetical protein BDR22DRAFT_821536 [Usnea florida]
MSSEGTSVDVASWLSQVNSSPDSSSPSLNRKRKRCDSAHPSNRHRQPRQDLFGDACVPSHQDTMDPHANQATVSPKKRQRVQAQGGNLTPDTNSQKSSSRTRSSASIPKLANNVYNVRRLL